MEAIPWESLSSTLKDALSVSSALDIGYIWVDSLCILQGDEEDWERESAMMASVFGESDLTIAAADSPDSQGGLFLESIPPPSVVTLEDGLSKIMIRRGPGNPRSERNNFKYPRLGVSRAPVIQKKSLFH